MPEPLRLRLFENYRFVLYAPFYAAHATGAYAAEGLEVELLPSPGPGKAEAALAAGEVDVMWMGPIRVMKHHDENPDSPLVEFAEVVCRDPFSLVGHEPYPEFRLVELRPYAVRQHQRGADPVAVPRPGHARRRLRSGLGPAHHRQHHGGQRRRAARRQHRCRAALRAVCRAGGVRRRGDLVSGERSAGRPATPCSSRRATGWPATPSRSAAWRGRCAAPSNGSPVEPPRSLAAAIADYFPDLDRSVADPFAGALQGARGVGLRPAPLARRGSSGCSARCSAAVF